MAAEMERHSTPASTDRALVKAEHVWVCVTGTWGDASCPGLLLEWRTTRDGRWEGLVVWVLRYSGGWDLRQGWMRAEHLRRRG
ncbi:hypothetical protein ABFT23_22445 [Nocardioides sp. C4-1]|uniref:hypothetical protein n=1 Tax=Nocardioides sp. C4-1 TaxID=3151851 RepID=UPI00326384ED